MDQNVLDIEIEPLDISELQDHSSEAEENESEDDESKHRISDPEVYESDQLSTPKRLENSAEDSTSESSSKESIEEPINANTIFVKMKLPNGKTFTTAANAKMTIQQLKSILGKSCRVPSDVIDLWENVGKLKLIKNETDELFQFNINKGNLEFIVTTKDPEIELFVLENELAAPVDIITVSLDIPNQTPRQIVVEIENQIERKFLGGVRCKRTNKEYFHAETQTTYVHVNREKVVIKRSRTCQTNSSIHVIQQTTVSKEIQTLDSISEHDKVITPRSGLSSADSEHVANITSKVITIQRIWRGWKARQSFQKFITQIKTEKALDEMFQSEQKPGYTPAVFEVLYQLVEKWRKKCLAYAYAMKTEGPTRADFQDILEMQVNLLAIIEKERIKMHQKIKKEREQKLLEQSCSPVVWKGYKGLKISMETMESQRAAELKKLYDVLSQENLTIDHRKENLSTVQAALKCYKNEKCNEILALINRELQLLDMGFGSKEIESLHKRIEKLFVHFIREPKTLKVSPCSDNFYLCVQCKKMLPPTSFVVPLRDPKIKLCASCHWLDNISHKRINHSPYQLILRELREEEVKHGCYKSLAFIMESYDVHYLIDQIWHCQSAISQTSSINELRLGRWDKTQDWTPWNTILLTKSELKDHSQITDLEKVYGQNFIKNVKVKLLMARMHFTTMYHFKTE